MTDDDSSSSSSSSSQQQQEQQQQQQPNDVHVVVVQRPRTLRPARENQKLRFYRKVAIKRVPHRSEYSEEESSKIWLQRPELEQIRNDFRETIELVVLNMLRKDTEEHCIRGTEIGNPDIIEPRRNHRNQATAAVMGEYELQKHKGVFSEDLLQEIYHPFSLHSTTVAHQQGIEDAFEVAKLSKQAAPGGRASSSSSSSLRTRNKKNPHSTSTSTKKNRNKNDEVGTTTPPTTIKKRTRRMRTPEKKTPQETARRRRLDQLIAFYEMGGDKQCLSRKPPSSKTFEV